MSNLIFNIVYSPQICAQKGETQVEFTENQKYKILYAIKE